MFLNHIHNFIQKCKMIYFQFDTYIQKMENTNDQDKLHEIFHQVNNKYD